MHNVEEKHPQWLEGPDAKLGGKHTSNKRKCGSPCDANPCHDSNGAREEPSREDVRHVRHEKREHGSENNPNKGDLCGGK